MRESKCRAYRQGFEAGFLEGRAVAFREMSECLDETEEYFGEQIDVEELLG